MKENSSIHMAISIMSLAGAIIAPVLYINSIKSEVAVQSQRITTLELNNQNSQSDISLIKQDVAKSKAYLEILLSKQGISPGILTTKESI